MINHIIAYIFFSIGLIFMLIAILGMWKNKSFFVSITLSSLIDTLAFLCFGIGIIIYIGWQLVSLKILFLIGIFLFLNPMASHILAKSANTKKTAPTKEESN